MKKLKQKLRAILDILFSNQFYLVTFDGNNNVLWRTEYYVDAEEIHDKI